MLKCRIQAYSRNRRVDRKYTVLVGSERKHVAGSYFFADTLDDAEAGSTELRELAKLASQRGLQGRFTASFDNHSGNKLSVVLSSIRSWLGKEDVNA